MHVSVFYVTENEYKVSKINLMWSKALRNFSGSNSQLIEGDIVWICSSFVYDFRCLFNVVNKEYKVCKGNFYDPKAEYNFQLSCDINL